MTKFIIFSTGLLLFFNFCISIFVVLSYRPASSFKTFIMPKHWFVTVGSLKDKVIRILIYSEDEPIRVTAKQSLGAIQKAMEMYLMDKDVYPKELDTGSDVLGSQVAGSLGQYTNITSLFAAFRTSSTVGSSASCTGADCAALFDITGATIYTISVRARDRIDSPAYATGGVGQENVWSVLD